MNKPLWGGVLTIAVAMLFSACSEKAKYDPEHQAGSNPPLPSAQNFMVPPMQVPEGVGWKDGQTPKVAAGLKIEKIASGLKHPRQVYVLPNQDVLVVESSSPKTEPVTTPKQLIAGMVTSRSGKGAKGGNRVTLLRKKANGSGEWDQYVLIDKLNSPFGVQLIGDTLYVADTDALLKFPYATGETRISA
ncbi:sorbosone dehydrogenase family protein, partial [Burkholderia gladioli]|nr:sorbosone dehydrogenase family protein [Burkholderia gladioli]